MNTKSLFISLPFILSFSVLFAMEQKEQNQYQLNQVVEYKKK
jgi:hypothetical protein